MKGMEQVNSERNPVRVETITEITEAVLEAAQKLIPEIKSVNQVPITKEWLESIIKSDSTVLLKYI